MTEQPTTVIFGNVPLGRGVSKIAAEEYRKLMLLRDRETELVKELNDVRGQISVAEAEELGPMSDFDLLNRDGNPFTPVKVCADKATVEERNNRIKLIEQEIEIERLKAQLAAVRIDSEDNSEVEYDD